MHNLIGRQWLWQFRNLFYKIFILFKTGKTGLYQVDFFFYYIFMTWAKFGNVEDVDMEMSRSATFIWAYLEGGKARETLQLFWLCIFLWYWFSLGNEKIYKSNQIFSLAFYCIISRNTAIFICPFSDGHHVKRQGYIEA